MPRPNNFFSFFANLIKLIGRNFLMHSISTTIQKEKKKKKKLTFASPKWTSQTLNIKKQKKLLKTRTKNQKFNQKYVDLFSGPRRRRSSYRVGGGGANKNKGGFRRRSRRLLQLLRRVGSERFSTPTSEIGWITGTGGPREYPKW